MTLEMYIKRGVQLSFAIILSIALFVGYLFLTPIYEFKRARIYAQAIFELSCPLGTNSVQSLQSINQSTGKYRQNWCVDINGNVTTSFGASTTIISFIQVTGVDLPAANQTVFTAPFPANNLQGDLLVLVERLQGPTFTVTDSQGNNWQQSSNQQFWYALNCKGGANTVTLTWASATHAQLEIAEYSGVSPTATIDQQAFNGSPSGTNWSTAPVTTASPGELLIGWGNNGVTNTPTYTQGSGYTLRTSGTNVFIEDSLQSAIGPASATLGTAGYASGAIGLATFRNAIGNTSPSPITGLNLFNGACVGPNCFLLQNYGATFDVREVNDVSWSGGGNTITCPNNDCNFTPAQNNSLCLAMPGGSMNAGPTVAGVFLFVSAQSATCTASAVIGSAVANGVFTWGHDDTAAFVAASAALYAQPKCGTLILPAGRGFLKQGVSPNFAVATDCGITIIGQGYTSTTIEMLPGFSFTQVTNGMTCAALGCFWNSTASSTYFNFTVNGELQNLSGVSANNITSLFTLPNGGLAQQVDFFNWATSVTNLGSGGGTQMTGFGAYGIGWFQQNWGTGSMNFANYNLCFACGTVGNNIHITGILEDTGGTYNGGVIVDGGGVWIAKSTSVPAATGAFNVVGCSNGSMDLYHAFIGKGSPNTAGIGLQIFNYSGTNCNVHARSTLFNGGATGAAVQVNASSTLDLFLDDNGNTFSSPAFVNNGTLRVHHRESGTCTFSAATTCVVTFGITFGNSTNPSFMITPVNPGAVTFTVTALSQTAATITASGVNSLSVGWDANLQ